jgi:uncharacterized protein DUF4032/lipopolysaccharide kinase (Kdo/WaaP) family protein
VRHYHWGVAVQLRFHAQQVPPYLIDLPWPTSLEKWDHPLLVTRARGPSRHVVRFVSDGQRAYALKEMARQDAEREYRMLREMRPAGLPVVEAVGLVTGRETPEGQPLPAALVTRFLDYSLPFRYLFGVEGGSDLAAKLIDAAVVLLVRLHVEGFFWGDCSLSNLLFRRDAGALMAYLVDAETAEHHARPLSDRMREFELDLARENIAGGLLDLTAEGRLSPDVDVIALVNRLEERYRLLWNELTGTLEIDAAEKNLIDQRIRRINELGFDVEELVVEGDKEGERIKVVPALVEEGHHARELRRLTGLEVQENQARRLLNDIAAYGAYLSRVEGRQPSLEEAAARWLAEVYKPIVARIPEDLRGRIEDPELFHELLEHRYYLSEANGYEVDNDTGLKSYIDSVLRFRPKEQKVFLEEG